ncbi:hypothetical protein [Magnetospirillum molischianum]|uniref:DUF3990 domain-containing protein n=1 Tax=Magnetospirillum molischianum DSM 120 TaxID=1150626 RepID=H8FVP4_MAGML|nr:hypothetical protein [Magnetospirillum molischianum]CCG42432.1 conserved hypothetical protein [Magnetospirillum molischianum DSM 120]
MSRLHTSFVLGYHGCDAAIGENVLAGHAVLNASEQQYDWLGPGVYFWEADPQRALEWAEWKVSRGEYETPFVVGAIINLGACLDLMSRESLETLAFAYESLKSTHDMDRDLGDLPVNKKAHSGDEDILLRYLDCAVIRRLHAAMDEAGEPFETVRGLFTEGGELFPAELCWNLGDEPDQAAV